MNTVYGDRSSQGVNPFGQFGLLLGFLGLGFVLATLVTVIIPIAAFHISLAQVPEALLNPKNIQMARFVQFASTLFLFAVPAFLYAKVAFGKPLQHLGFTAHANVRQFYFVLLLIIAALFAQSTIAQLNEAIPIPHSWEVRFKQMEDDYSKEVLKMAQMKTVGDYIYALIILAFLPALFEEIFFRGALQQVLIRLCRNVFAGIFITGLLFSLAHFSFYGFLTRAFLGVLLGYIFYYGKNIWLNITAHFLNNAIVVTSLYAMSRSGELTEKSLDDETYPIYVGILAIITVLALFVFFKRESAKTVQVTHDGVSEEYILGSDHTKENGEPL